MLTDVMMIVVMPSVVMLSVVMLNVIMLGGVMLSVVMLNVVMLGDVKLSVVMLSVVAPHSRPAPPSRWQCIKTFFSSLASRQNKLECFSQASILRLI